MILNEVSRQTDRPDTLKVSGRFFRAESGQRRLVFFRRIQKANPGKFSEKLAPIMALLQIAQKLHAIFYKKTG